MKITKNTSQYETKKLKSLFCFIHSQLAKHEGRMPWWDDLNINIQHKSYDYSGRAFLSPPRWKEWGMFLSISPHINLEDIAQLFAHELMHNYGYNHSQFNRDPLSPKEMEVIKNKFNKDDLLKPDADLTLKIKQQHVKIPYEELVYDLAAQYSWLHIEEMGHYGYGLEIEVIDERLDFEFFYSAWLTETDNNTTYRKAYLFARKLIKGELQKEWTKNFTYGMNPDWEE